MTAIWSRDGEEWSLLPPVGFPDERTLHTLVEEAPQLLPLAGLRRSSSWGARCALVQATPIWIRRVEPNGRVVVVEVKLAENSDARRAVVAQILAYAAVLHGMSPEAFEREVLAEHLGGAALEQVVQDSEQVLEFDADAFRSGLASSLESGGFRLVLVLDSAPPELVRLVGYLEAMTAGLVIDLIVVAAYDVGGKTVMVPQRVDPDHAVADRTLGAPNHVPNPRTSMRRTVAATSRRSSTTQMTRSVPCWSDSWPGHESLKRTGLLRCIPTAAQPMRRFFRASLATRLDRSRSGERDVSAFETVLTPCPAHARCTGGTDGKSGSPGHARGAVG